MPLFNLPTDITPATNQLECIAYSLERIAAALERISPPPRLPLRAHSPTTLEDIAVASPEHIASTQSAMVDFAQQQFVVPGSEAYCAKVKEYEQQILEHVGHEEGQLIIASLPWNIIEKPEQPEQPVS